MSNQKTKAQRVIIVGAGPVGLTAAMLLGHHGIECLVIEFEDSVPRDLRASTFHPPTLDMLDQFGITSKLIAAGLVAPTWQVRWHTTGEFAEFDLSVLKGHTAHPYRLQCEQWRLAEFLIEHIRLHLPCIEIKQGCRVDECRQNDDGVEVFVTGPGGDKQAFSGAYLIGADGGRSVVRSQLKLEFEGHTFPETTVLATTSFPFHEHVPNLSFINYCWKDSGTFSLLRLRDLWRVSLYPRDGESEQEATSPLSIESKLQEIFQKDTAYDVMEIRPYKIHQRVVKSYVHGRMILAGDAAHINSPSGGMGMNGGIHDAFNLVEKLQRIYAGESQNLLMLYERQRRPVALKHVLEQSGRNRARMQERDDGKRRQALTELQRKSDDKTLAEAYLLETSMINGLREAASIE